MGTWRKSIVYDDETGEVKHVKMQGMDFLFPDGKGYRLFMNRRSVRHFPDIDYPPELSKMDIANLHLLSRKILGDTCMLGYKSGGLYKPMDEEQMRQIVGLCEKRFKTWLNRVIKLGMMARGTMEYEGGVFVQYYMSPLYFFSGIYLPLHLYLLFKDQLDRHLPRWAIEKYMRMAEVNTA